MARDEEPELPLEPTPAINWSALRKRAYLLVTAPKLPAWAVILLLVVKEVPGWRSRFEFWLAAAKSLGGLPGIIASIVASNYFAPIAGVMAAAYIVLIGEEEIVFFAFEGRSNSCPASLRETHHLPNRVDGYRFRSTHPTRLHCIRTGAGCRWISATFTLWVLGSASIL
jgi:hypothetical protein